MAEDGDKVILLHSMRDALAYGDGWQAHAQRIEALLLLATAQRDASELLLRYAEDAEDELKRLRSIIK